MVGNTDPLDRSAYTPQFARRLSRELGSRIDQLTRDIREARTADDLDVLDEKGAPQAEAIRLNRASASFRRHVMPEGNVVVMRIPFSGDATFFASFPDEFDQQRREREFNAYVHGGEAGEPSVEFRGVFQDASRDAVHAWGKTLADRLESLFEAQAQQIDKHNQFAQTRHREEIAERRRVLEAGEAMDDLGTGI